MDNLKGLDMKGPIRPAPSVPTFAPTRYSPVTNWNDDPFGGDVFEPTPAFQKKKPPPRPPPPKIKRQPDVPNKPSYFIRKPTVLTSLMSRKDKTAKPPVQPKPTMEFHNENMQKIFQKCDFRNVQTASLIDLSSPPSSPTFTTRSSSDGLSVDSFGSDATSSTNQHRLNGNQSQAESGFEDDFDLFLSARKPIGKDDTVDDFANFDPFSPPVKQKIVSKLSDQYLCNGKTVQPAVTTHKMPTIIRAKPARPKPPETSALLKTAFAAQTNVAMKLNMSAPIERVNAGVNYYSTAPQSIDWSPERESSPPMPSVPPPPPPVLDPSDLQDQPIDFQDQLEWPLEDSSEFPNINETYREESNAILNTPSERETSEESEPYAIALYDYHGEHADDLSFSANMKVKLIRRLDSEWLYGRLRSGAEGIFPANYVEVRVPLAGETVAPPRVLGTAVALYDFEPSHPGDLPFTAGDKITVTDKINDEWYFGECKGLKGQFPANYVQRC